MFHAAYYTFLRLGRVWGAAALALTLCGCASLHFTALRKSRFIDMDADILHVDYGKEKRTETFPNGLTYTFHDKVRLHLPEGKTIVLYETIGTVGLRYVSSDKHYEFLESGPYCILHRDGKTIFEGVFCKP